MRINLLVVGHGEHGKDEICEMINAEYGLTFESSSRFCSRLFIYDLLRSKYGYLSEYECYLDRRNRRTEWYNAIEDFNKDDAARLGKEIFASFDIYCGLRSDREFFAMKEQGIFDASIWVDASVRKASENPKSMALRREWMDYAIDNNGDLLTTLRNTRIVMDDILCKLTKAS